MTNLQRSGLLRGPRVAKTFFHFFRIPCTLRLISRWATPAPQALPQSFPSLLSSRESPLLCASPFSKPAPSSSSKSRKASHKTYLTCHKLTIGSQRRPRNALLRQAPPFAVHPLHRQGWPPFDNRPPHRLSLRQPHGRHTQGAIRSRRPSVCPNPSLFPLSRTGPTGVQWRVPQRAMHHAHIHTNIHTYIPVIGS